jgi:hypothetical protein
MVAFSLGALALLSVCTIKTVAQASMRLWRFPDRVKHLQLTTSGRQIHGILKSAVLVPEVSKAGRIFLDEE